MAAVNNMAEALLQGNNKVVNGRAAAVLAFNKSALYKTLDIKTRLAVKMHVLKGENYTIFSVFDFKSADGIAEYESYIHELIAELLPVPNAAV